MKTVSFIAPSGHTEHWSKPFEVTQYGVVLLMLDNTEMLIPWNRVLSITSDKPGSLSLL